MTSSDYRYNVSKLVNIDGRFYDLKITPAGDKLTLTPSTAPLGQRDQPERRLPRVIYSDDVFPQDPRQQGHAGPRSRGPVEAAVVHHQPDGDAEAERTGGKESGEEGGVEERFPVAGAGEAVGGASRRRCAWPAPGPAIRSSRPRRPPTTRRSRSARARRSSCPSARRTSPW